MISSSGGGSVFAEPPPHFVESLQRTCPDTFLKRLVYSFDETVWPVVGLAFRRVVDPRSLGVWHQEMRNDQKANAPPVMADSGCSPAARWCIFQKTRFGREEHLMDLVHADGKPHPFDKRVVAAIKRREVKDKHQAFQMAEDSLDRPAQEAKTGMAQQEYALADWLRWFRRRHGGGVCGDYYLGGADGTQRAPQACRGYTVIDKRASAKMGAVV